MPTCLYTMRVGFEVYIVVFVAGVLLLSDFVIVVDLLLLYALLFDCLLWIGVSYFTRACAQAQT